MIKLIFKIISPALSAAILLFLTSWLFGKVNIAPSEQPTRIPIRLSSQNPLSPENSKPAEAKLMKKREIKENQVNNKGRLSRNTPVIRIYYGQDDIKDYIRYLAANGCIFLVQTGSGNLFAEYEPKSGFLGPISGQDLKGYSPRTRILARYGESRFFDLVIEKAVSLNSDLNSPESCRIIALVSRQWENSLLTAIFDITGTNRLKSSGIASADIYFQGGRFILKTVSNDAGVKHEINLTLPL